MSQAQLEKKVTDYLRNSQALADAVMILGHLPTSPTYPVLDTGTRNEMIVWGGYSSLNRIFYNTGGRYNATTDSWTATSTTNAPSARSDHTAVWTGSSLFKGLNQGESLSAPLVLSLPNTGFQMCWVIRHWSCTTARELDCIQ